jgi:AraC-like DNA-binding protein
MLFEKSTLASVVTVFIEAMEKGYQFDLRPVLSDLGMDLEKVSVSGARYPDAIFDGVWDALQRKTGDDCVGLTIGQYIRPTTFHALGYAWLASSTLAGAFRRLERYDKIVSTVDNIEVHDYENYTVLTLRTIVDVPEIPQAADAYFMGIVKLCQWVSDSHTVPLEVRFRHPDYGRAGDYVTAFGAPVKFGADANQLLFDRSVVEKPLPGENTQLASVNDQVAEHYLETLDPKIVASQVRSLLLKLLPSGDVTQQRVADRLNRSTSSLQRQLRAEGASFNEVRDDVRKSLAIDYIQEGRLSLNEIAFLVGFSDQSNFSRAFRRWTGKAPKDWRVTQ